MRTACRRDAQDAGWRVRLGGQDGVAGPVRRGCCSPGGPGTVSAADDAEHRASVTPGLAVIL